MKFILIVEDDRDIRESFQSFLEIEGYKVVAAENGKKALEKVQSAPRSPSLIFLDLFMPHMSGLEFLKEYSQYDTPSPVVLCTACPRDHSEFIQAKQFAKHAISKPIDIDKALDLAKHYLE